MNEDVIIFQKYFESARNKIMVEAGAAGPVNLSISKLFRDNGWRCICIEPNPLFTKLHRDLNNEIYDYALSDKIENNVDFEIFTIPGNVQSGESYSSFNQKPSYSNRPSHLIKSIIKVNVITLNYLLETLNIDHIDFLSIDVEGWEIEVLKGFDHNKYQPKIIMIENIRHINEYKQYMNSIGYKLVQSLAVDEIYQKI